jgi:hypothetical protein
VVVMDKVQNDQQAFFNVNNRVRERDLIILRSDILVSVCMYVYVYVF